jgi:hypothetical protein
VVTVVLAVLVLINIALIIYIKNTIRDLQESIRVSKVEILTISNEVFAKIQQLPKEITIKNVLTIP